MSTPAEIIGRALSHPVSLSSIPPELTHPLIEPIAEPFTYERGNQFGFETPAIHFWEWSIELVDSLESGVYLRGTIYRHSDSLRHNFGFWAGYYTYVYPENGWFRIAPRAEMSGQITAATGSGLYNTADCTVNFISEAYQLRDGERRELSRVSESKFVALALGGPKTNTFDTDDVYSFPAIDFPLDDTTIPVHVALTVEIQAHLEGDSRITLGQGKDSALAQCLRIQVAPFQLMTSHDSVHG